jgi:hypothetical protein
MGSIRARASLYPASWVAILPLQGVSVVFDSVFHAAESASAIPMDED